jgi:hypothetical protein
MLNTSYVLSHVHIIAPLVMGKTFLIRTGTALFSAKTKLITVSFAADGTGNGE